MRRTLLGALVLMLAACADQTATTGAGERGGPPDLDRPPDIVVRGGGEALTLRPYTFCWGNGCADGMPPDPLPDIGAQPELTVEFLEEDWTFTASFQRAGDPCARTQTVELDRASSTRHLLPPAGLAGTYDVGLFGRGPGGDVAAEFRWTTGSDGEPPAPEALISVLAGHDGEVDSYGVEMSVSNLARSPDRARATVTVTAAGGGSLTFTPTPANPAPDGCGAVEGLLSWDGPDSRGQEATRLGEPPFTYTVDLVLDGVGYRATATWPDDVIPDYEPYVSLAFTPPLPALSADESAD